MEISYKLIVDLGFPCRRGYMRSRGTRLSPMEIRALSLPAYRPLYRFPNRSLVSCRPAETSPLHALGAFYA